MRKRINKFLDVVSDFLAHRKGFLPLVGIALILINLILQFFPVVGWWQDSNIFLHIGVLIAILGLMIAWAL